MQDRPICCYCGAAGAAHVLTKPTPRIKGFADLQLDLYRCVDCDLLFTSPLSEDFVAAVGDYFVNHWDNRERIYVPAQQAQAVWHDPSWRKLIKAPLRMARNMLYRAGIGTPAATPSREGEALPLVWRRERFSLLDIGCSYGTFVRSARMNGADAFGVDPNRELVDALHRLGVDFIEQGLFPESHGPRERYDVMSFISVVDYFPRLTPAFFAECRRRLNAGGTLLICDIDPDLPAARDTLSLPIAHVFQSRRFMERAAAEAGFASCVATPCVSEPRYIFYVLRCP